MFNPAKLKLAIQHLQAANKAQQEADIPEGFREDEYDMGFTYDVHNSIENLIMELEEALDLLGVEA